MSICVGSDCDVDTTVVDAEQVGEVGTAKCFDVGLDKDQWIPNKMIVNWDEDAEELELPTWFAAQRGII